MFEPVTYSKNMEDKYEQLSQQGEALLSGETDQIANLSNVTALLNQFLDRVNWVGFYLYKEGELVLGPFQGLPACIRIPIGKGVCGTAAETGNTQVVENVHEFPGHIACDAQSQSEIVVPIMIGNELFGVLDIDSPDLGRFSEEEGALLEKFVNRITPFIGE
ncbi:GAF domain-containing protein [Salicibibacter halophilus]|uniref:GAF domain-containing protein n=1 Tax=Salicibibacter halophilus TaxID=2502791 RepID=A0A514LH59_9BACI|nr:GAF domain-containing protein [Salicibibacter halophilus]QDI91184.1 GAF domain-containing protein [Salicibibacter halophilus]